MTASPRHAVRAPRTRPFRGLRRLPPAQEDRYRREVVAARSRYFTPTALLGVVLFDAYSVVDAAVAPQVLGLSLALRLGLVTPLALAMLVWRRRHLRRHPAARVDGPVVAGGAVLLVAVLTALQAAAPGALDGAYFMGAHALVVFHVTLLRSDVRHAALVAAALLASFAASHAVLGLPAGLAAAALLGVSVSAVFGLLMAVDVESSDRAAFRARTREHDLGLERERLIAALDAAATHDQLTGLLNRRGLVERMAGRGDGPCTVLMVDVDHFKAYNDRFGHPRGDACLTLVAGAIAGAVRPDDVLARFGGEEFTVVLDPDGAAPGDCGAAQRAADRVREAVAALGLDHPARGDGTSTVTVSVGAARGETWEAAVRGADTALYAAKAAGRDAVRLQPLPGGAA